jgi:hypothetical protein
MKMKERRMEKEKTRAAGTKMERRKRKRRPKTLNAIGRQSLYPKDYSLVPEDEV